MIHNSTHANICASTFCLPSPSLYCLSVFLISPLANSLSAGDVHVARVHVCLIVRGILQWLHCTCMILTSCATVVGCDDGPGVVTVHANLLHRYVCSCLGRESKRRSIWLCLHAHPTESLAKKPLRCGERRSWSGVGRLTGAQRPEVRGARLRQCPASASMFLFGSACLRPCAWANRIWHTRSDDCSALAVWMI